jgi:predicted amidohydrolase YtcJ
MKKIIKYGLLFVLAIMICAGIVYYTSLPPKSIVFLNGHVLTMGKNNRVAEAVAVRNGMIEAVGTSGDIKAYIKNDSKIIDLGGKTMIPGIVDAHSHFPGSGLYAAAADLNSPPIGKTLTVNQAVNTIKEIAAETKKGKWVLGFGYDDTLMAEKRYLTREDLDRASTEHPIYVMHVSGHIGMANSLALELAGIDSTSKNPDGGIIRKDGKSGEPLGVLEEHAQYPVQSIAMQFSMIDGLKIVAKGARGYARMGVTTAQCGLADEKMIKGLSFNSRVNLVPLRLVVWPDYSLGLKMISREIDLEKFNTAKFQVGAIKLIADGSIQGYTGYLNRPYHTPFDGDDQYRGYPTIDRETLTGMISTVHKAGYQLAVHGNGDAAIENIIYAFDKAQRENFQKDPRLILIHAQMTRDDQLNRMKELGITPSFFVAHTYYWGDRHWDIFMGPERAKRMSPCNSAIQKGIPFTIHLDTPVVPMNPMLLVWSAVNRASTGGRIIGEKEKISPIQALRAITIDAAWQIFQEDNRGSIEKGKFADLVVLSGNPLEDPERIRDIEVMETIVGGKTVYQKDIL